MNIHSTLACLFELACCACVRVCSGVYAQSLEFRRRLISALKIKIPRCIVYMVARVIPPSSHRTQDAVAPQRENSSAAHFNGKIFCASEWKWHIALFICFSFCSPFSGVYAATNNGILSVVFLTAGASTIGWKNIKSAFIAHRKIQLLFALKCHCSMIQNAII